MSEPSDEWIDRQIDRQLNPLEYEDEPKPRGAAGINRVDRFEVIDETGRAYVKGSIYGSPVQIQLSYQDDGRTLKVFVRRRDEKQA